MHIHDGMHTVFRLGDAPDNRAAITQFVTDAFNEDVQNLIDTVRDLRKELEARG
jgi:hypothetical protein